MAAVLGLYVNHVLIAGMEWGVSFEEVLGGTGRATINVQDRTNTWEPETHWDVKVVILSSGWVLFRGEIIREPVNLTVMMPFRVWQLDCADYNNELDKRLVGAFDGKTWIDQFGFGFFVNIDPNAITLATDRLSVQNWFDVYMRVDGAAIETVTFVGEYLTDFFPISYSYSTLQRALEELAALIVNNLQFWIDPDLFFHWVTIPAWQDLAQDAITVGADDTESTLAGLLPEGAPAQLDLAPGFASDIRDEAGDQIGFSNLSWDYDGSDMPQQIYVRGGTGYVYNAPPIPAVEETKTVVKNATPGVAATYSLTFNSSTKIWHTDGTGFVSTSFTTAAAGGPYAVKYVQIAWSPSRNKGGMFWKLLTGPYAGKLADNDTNYFGYGSITVVQTTATAGTPADPKVGIGGSGFVGEAVQDRNKRQAYLEAPLSVTQEIRDSFGGQALYRAQFPTLRGSVDVFGIDGWRVGQLLRVKDARLPTALNNRYFVIQRVRSTLIPTTDLRRYTLDFGDGPASRYSAQLQQKGDDGGWPPPAIQIDITIHDLSPGPNSSQVVTGQLVNGSGEAWAIVGKTVNWSFEAYNSLGVLQAGQGSINPTVSITDQKGRARTTLTTGATAGLVYYVFANVVAT